MLIITVRGDYSESIKHKIDKLGVVSLGNGLWVAGGSLPWRQGDIVCRRRNRRFSDEEVVKALVAEGADASADWAPAFRLAWQAGAEVRAVADWAGLGHWFIWTGDGIAAIADSATSLAQAFGLVPNVLAFAGLALAGEMIGDDSAIAGVRKLPCGHAARLSGGTLSLVPVPPPPQLSEGMNTVAVAVNRLLHAFPEAGFEVSGGWDSRMVLAAAEEPMRRGRFGLTIGDSSSGDVIVAGQIAAALGLDHKVIAPDLSPLDSDSLWDLLADAAHRDDHCANPLDRAAINYINALLGAGTVPPPRFSGQNGEILRGFYYPGQPVSQRPSQSLAERLTGWRILSNDVVDPALFDPVWLADARTDLKRRIVSMLLETGDTEWGRATDRYYFTQRMRRWCGTSVSATLGRRAVLLPFFDADVVAFALTQPSSAKAGSRLAAQLIASTDPALAALPLETGLVPNNVAAGGLVTRAVAAQRFGRKVLGKVRQRLAGRDRPTLGSASTLALTVQHKLPGRVDCHALARLGIFNNAQLESFSNGTWAPARSTVGFIYNTHFLLGRLRKGLS